MPMRQEVCMPLLSSLPRNLADTDVNGKQVGHYKTSYPAGLFFCVSATSVTSISVNLRFHIQLNYTAEGPYERAARRDLEPITNVAPLTLGPLDEAEYAAFIDHCHVVLMPYCPNRYKARGSGLIHEAIQRGRPVVVPANTELGSFVSQSRIGSVFDVYQPASIAHAIQQVARRYDTYLSAVQRTAARRNPVREADEYINLLRRTQS